MTLIERIVIWTLIYLGFLSLVKSINRVLDKLDDSMTRKETSNVHAD